MHARSHEPSTSAWVRPCLGALVFIGLSLSAAVVQAQAGFNLQTMSAAPSPQDGLIIQKPMTLPHLEWAAQLVLDYAHEPLVSPGYGSADPAEVDIVRGRTSGQVVAALGLYDRYELFVRAPVTLYQAGDSSRPGGLVFRTPRAAGLGDMALGGSVRMFGDSHGFAAGAHASVWLPTGSRAALSGDGNVGGRLGLSLQYEAMATALAFESGARLRAQSPYGSMVSGSQWYYRAALHKWLTRAWRLMLEVDGSTLLSDGQLFQKDKNGIEAYLAIRYGLSPGLFVTGGVGTGFISAPGTPLARAIVSVGYQAPVKRSEGR